MHQNRSNTTLTRREWVRLSSAGIAGSSLSGWLGTLAAHAKDVSPKKHKSCVLLWMDGGPSQIETFDPKPDASERVRGDLKAIATSVPGIQISEKFSKLSRLMQHVAILRSMSTAEADHGRARIYMHTGYKPRMGGVNYPSLGSTVSAEIGWPEAALPNFVVTGTPLNKHDVLRDPGFRGPKHQPLVLDDVKQGIENLRPAVAAAEFDRRAGLLQRLEAEFTRTNQATRARSHQESLNAALRLMRSPHSRAFDLSLEPENSRSAYGDSDFGRGCLLARRLVESGVPFVEVYLSNWDSHVKRVAEQTRTLMSQVDAGASALVRDLETRGLLEDTLIIWMGEFGRTPTINSNAGRDHYAKAWTTMLMGGGVKGGQVVGATDSQGREVKDRPITVKDFMATICQLLGIDYRKEVTTPNGRPIRIVDKGERVVEEVVSKPTS
ncbi:MAG: DUF1501 domain-containing protein [Planctomycetes bacterium]|nr:DUF1501 domain-containing protein [Planctomycetota bacterium]